MKYRLLINRGDNNSIAVAYESGDKILFYTYKWNKPRLLSNHPLDKISIPFRYNPDRVLWSPVLFIDDEILDKSGVDTDILLIRNYEYINKNDDKEEKRHIA